VEIRRYERTIAPSPRSTFGKENAAFLDTGSGGKSVL
jgi:hypothetical protein